MFSFKTFSFWKPYSLIVFPMALPRVRMVMACPGEWGGGYSQKNWVGVCCPLPKILTLFMTKICDFPYSIYKLSKIWFLLCDHCRRHSCHKHKLRGASLLLKNIPSSRWVQKPNPIYDQNGQNRCAIYDQSGFKNHTFAAVLHCGIAFQLI